MPKYRVRDNLRTHLHVYMWKWKVPYSESIIEGTRNPIQSFSKTPISTPAKWPTAASPDVTHFRCLAEDKANRLHGLTITSIKAYDLDEQIKPGYCTHRTRMSYFISMTVHHLSAAVSQWCHSHVVNHLHTHGAVPIYALLQARHPPLEFPQLY